MQAAEPLLRELIILLFCHAVDQIVFNHSHAKYFMYYNIYPVNLQYSNYKHVFSIRVKKLWILIRWLHQKSADLDLHCFQKQMDLGSAGQLSGRALPFQFFLLYFLCSPTGVRFFKEILSNFILNVAT